MKINLTIETDNISGLVILDMDSAEWGSRPIRREDWEAVEAIKADGEYFKIPEGTEEFSAIFTDENKISEYEALGLERMMKMYISGDTKATVTMTGRK